MASLLRRPEQFCLSTHSTRSSQSHICALLFSAFLAIAGCTPSLPTREDCIVAIAVDWPSKATLNDRSSTIYMTVQAIRSAAEDLGSMYAAHMAAPGDLEHLYLQFERGCDARLRKAEELARSARDQLPDGVILNVLHDRIRPGLETIAVAGPSWRSADGD